MSLRPRVSSWGLHAILCAVALLVGTLAHADEHKEARLDVGALAGGVTLVEQTFVLEDRTGSLTLEDVMKSDAPFVRSTEEASFGFSRSTFWVRLEAFNPTARSQPWLLELAFPHLDRVDLYEQRADGTVRHRQAGDRIPFGVREVDVPSFVFPTELEPGCSAVYYLRVSSAGAIRVPLRAWMALDFASHESQQNLILWLFYGVVAAMICFNAGTALLLKQREYVFHVCLLIAMGGGIFTLSGQTFQYLLPNHPAVANRALSTCLAFGLLSVSLYVGETFGPYRQIPALDRIVRICRWTLPPFLLLLVIALLAPHAYSQMTVFAVIVLYIPLAAHMIVRALVYGGPQLRLHTSAFIVIAIMIPLALLAHAKVIPPYTFAIWAGHIGCACYSILMALSLPIRINELGQRLAGLNEQLSENVFDLKRALARAEQATKVKDEFMATMSHELRTPLNAIINVPQGLLEDFPLQAAAICASCNAEFRLDPGEVVGADTACPECQRKGTLRAEDQTVYVGKPAHTARFLRKIERSGHHLLQMVNGVLDFSKMEAGRLELQREAVDMRSLLTDVADQTSDLALGRGIAIKLVLADSSDLCLVDATRIRQVLLNLLTNAIKFSESGSTICVSFERDAETDRISVADQGIGIAAEDHERVFASFEQVHKGDTRKYGGTGLGLSISRSLVRMHGGELWVESQLGQGSTFIFTLPRTLAHVSVVGASAAVG